MVERGELPGWTAPTRIVRIKPNRWVVAIAALIAFLSLVMDGLTMVDRGVTIVHGAAPPTSQATTYRTNIIAPSPMRGTPPTTSGQTGTTFPNYTGGTCSTPSFTLAHAGDSQSFSNNWLVGNQVQGGTGVAVMSVCNPASWYTTINQAGTNQVAWFEFTSLFTGPPPAINNSAGIPLNQFTSITSTYGDTLPAGQVDAEAAYDIWFNSLCQTATAQGPPFSAPWSSPPHDTMIWNDWTSYGNGLNNFSGNDSQASWAAHIEAIGIPVTLGGVAYHWLTGNGGQVGGPNIGDEKIFVRDTPNTSGTVNILAVLNYLAGQTSVSEISPNSCLSVIDYGFEVDGTNGSQRMDVTNFQVTTT